MRISQRCSFRTLSMAFLNLKVENEIALEDIVKKLNSSGYRRVNILSSKGEYAVRGGIFDIYPLGCDAPIRLEFFGDEIKSIRKFELSTQKTINELDSITLEPVLIDDKIRISYDLELDSYEGPLDLLLYLIQKNELKITEISIEKVTEQYLEYINMMEILDLDIASDFVLMAATLIQLKSQSILPSDSDKKDKKTPEYSYRELIQQLLEYKKFKNAVSVFEEKLEYRSKLFGRHKPKSIKVDNYEDITINATLFELLSAFKSALDLYREKPQMEVPEREDITVEDKMAGLTMILKEQPEISFEEMLSMISSRFELIVTFLAILELVRLRKIAILQKGLFDELRISRQD